MKKIIKRNGFTFIELIVTVTIIAIVTVIAVVNYSSANVKARDTRRRADLEKIRIALEMSRQVVGEYPSTKEELISGGYLSVWPVGPKGDVYEYVRGDSLPIGNNFTFVLRTRLEDLQNTMPDVDGDCGSGFRCNYEVANP